MDRNGIFLSRPWRRTKIIFVFYPPEIPLHHVYFLFPLQDEPSKISRSSKNMIENGNVGYDRGNCLASSPTAALVTSSKGSQASSVSSSSSSSSQSSKTTRTMQQPDVDPCYKQKVLRTIFDGLAEREMSPWETPAARQAWALAFHFLAVDEDVAKEVLQEGYETSRSPSDTAICIVNALAGPRERKKERQRRACTIS